MWSVKTALQGIGEVIYVKSASGKSFGRRWKGRTNNMNKDQLLRIEVLTDVDAERNRQNEKWGRQRHPQGDWLMILGEEYGEVCQAMQKHKGWGKESDASNLYVELIHLAAVAVAIAEQVKEEGH